MAEEPAEDVAAMKVAAAASAPPPKLFGRLHRTGEEDDHEAIFTEHAASEA